MISCVSVIFIFQLWEIFTHEESQTKSPLTAVFWELNTGAVGTVFLIFTTSAMVSRDCGAF